MENQNEALTFRITTLETAVEEYLNGFKIDFSFGNMMYTEMSNINFYIVLDNVSNEDVLLKKGSNEKIYISEVNFLNYENYSYTTHSALEEVAAGSWHDFSVTMPESTLHDIK